MTTVREIYNTLFAFAPASMKMDWDNVGLLCGRFDAPVELAKRYLPLFDLNLGWLLPACIGFVIGMILRASKPAKA